MSGTTAPRAALLLAALLGGCAAAAPDTASTLADLESARPPAVARLSMPTHAPAWDDERPAHDWPPLRATLETRDDRYHLPIKRQLWRGSQRLTELWSGATHGLTYLRNPLAPTRVSALRPSPASGVLVAYDQSTLLSLGHVADWDRLAGCGVDPRELTRLLPADEPPEQAFGVAFHWWVAPGGAGHEAAEATTGGEVPHLVRVAWNAELGLPWLVIVRLPDGSLQRQQLVDLDLAPDPAEPPDPVAEHPELRLIDLADLLEESHG